MSFWWRAFPVPHFNVAGLEIARGWAEPRAKLQDDAKVMNSKRSADKITDKKNKKLELSNNHLEISQQQQASEIAELKHQKAEVEKSLVRVEIERNQISEECDRYRERNIALEELQQSFESRMAEMEKEHNHTVNVIRKHCEDEKNTAIDQLEKERNSTIKKLEEEISFLTREKEVIETKVSTELKAFYLKEMDEVQTSMKAEMKKVVDDVQHDIENSHQREIQTLRQCLTKELDNERVKLEICCQKRVRALEVKTSIVKSSEKDLLEELEKHRHAMKAEMKKVIDEVQHDIEDSHQREIQTLRQCLTKELDDERVKLELCYQKSARALKVKASIAKSSEKDLLKELEKHRSALKVKEDEVNQLSSSNKNLCSRIAELEHKDLEANNHQIGRDLEAQQEDCTILENKLEKKLAAKDLDLSDQKLKVTQCRNISDMELQPSKDKSNYLNHVPQSEYQEESDDLFIELFDTSQYNIGNCTAEYQILLEKLTSE